MTLTTKSWRFSQKLSPGSFRHSLFPLGGAFAVLCVLWRPLCGCLNNTAKTPKGKIKKSLLRKALKGRRERGKIGRADQVPLMDDLSSPSNPLVMIALLVGLIVAGVQFNSHKDHFINQTPVEQTR